MSSATSDVLISFWRWLGKKKFKPPKHLKVAWFEDTGRGLLTTKLIYENELIISIPETLLITTDTVLSSRIGPCLKTISPKLSPLLALCAFLMVERALEAESEWQPYLAILPNFYPVPSSWPTRLQQYFTPTIRDSVRQQKLKIRSQYETLRPFLDKVKTTYHISEDFLSYKMFCWAWYTVNTRCVYMKCPTNEYLNNESNHCALAPFLDFFNHSFAVKVDAGFNSVTKAYEIRAKTKTLQRNQVFVNYGAHDNPTLLLNYGFIIPKNPYSVVHFTVDDILTFFGDVSKTASLLKMVKNKIFEEHHLIKDLVCTRDGPSWCMTSTVRFLLDHIKDQPCLEPENVLKNVFESRLVGNHKIQNSLAAIKRQSPLISTLTELLNEENDLLIFSIVLVSNSPDNIF